MISIKSKREIELMRETCKLAAETLEYLGEFVKPGVNTLELDEIAHEYITERGAYPSPLNYHGFPKSICTSPNEVVCHGIPDKSVVLKEGDILNIDVTTKLNGFHGDTNRTFYVGDVSPEVKKLVEITHECMMLGINEVRPGAHLGNIGAAISELAHSHGYSVVRDYCGHGIGREFHEEPQVLHYGQRNTGVVLRPGMTFTVEPMINVGGYQCDVLADKWTVVTRDRQLSAQFEHTILVTDDSYEILTLPPAH